MSRGCSQGLRLPGERHMLYGLNLRISEPQVTESCRYAALHVGPDCVADTQGHTSPQTKPGGGGTGYVFFFSMLCLVFRLHTWFHKYCFLSGKLCVRLLYVRLTN